MVFYLYDLIFNIHKNDHKVKYRCAVRETLTQKPRKP